MLNNELFFTKLIGDINMNIIFAFENFDSLAQLVEHIPFNDGVLGSNPIRITKAFLGRLFYLIACSINCSIVT